MTIDEKMQQLAQPGVCLPVQNPQSLLTPLGLPKGKPGPADMRRVISDPRMQSGIQSADVTIVPVPDVKGMGIAEAVEALKQLQLRPEVSAEDLLLDPSTAVVGLLDPATGSLVRIGRQVIIHLKDTKVQVPNVLRLKLADAEDKIENVGLVPVQMNLTFHPETAVVDSLDPPENTPVAVGTHISIFLVDTEPIDISPGGVVPPV